MPNIPSRKQIKYLLLIQAILLLFAVAYIVHLRRQPSVPKDLIPAVVKNMHITNARLSQERYFNENQIDIATRRANTIFEVLEAIEKTEESSTVLIANINLIEQRCRNKDVPNCYFKNAMEIDLGKNINDFRKELLNIHDSIISPQLNPKVIEMILYHREKLKLGAPIFKLNDNPDSIDDKWVKNNFKNIDNTTAKLLLVHLEHVIQLTLFEAIDNYNMLSYGNLDERHVPIEAMIVPNALNIRLGDSLKTKIFLAKTDWSPRYVVMSSGDTLRVDIKDHFANYSTKAIKLGKHVIKGYMPSKDYYGKKIAYPFQLEYTVIK